MSATGIHGLQRAPNGVYHIDKVIHGLRICRSTRTRNLVRARQILDSIVDEQSSMVVDNEWTREVKRAMEDSMSWLKRLGASMRRRGRENGKGCSLRLIDIRAIALRSNGHCEISGIPFDLTTSNRAFRPSIDRIDSTQGYHLNNCRMVCLIVNLAMHEWGLDAVRVLSRALAAQELMFLSGGVTGLSHGKLAPWVKGAVTY